MTKNCLNSWSQKGWCNKPTKLQFQSILNTENVDAIQILWSIRGSHKTLWSIPLPNVTWHSGTWPYTMTHSIDQTLHQFANLLLQNWSLLPILTLLPNFGGFHRTLQRVRLANRGRLLLRHLVLSHLRLAFVLMLRPFFPELVMSTDLLSLEHPSVLLFCSKRYESNEVDRRTWLHVPSGTHWSTSSDSIFKWKRVI